MITPLSALVSSVVSCGETVTKETKGLKQWPTSCQQRIELPNDGGAVLCADLGTVRVRAGVDAWATSWPCQAAELARLHFKSSRVCAMAAWDFGRSSLQLTKPMAGSRAYRGLDARLAHPATLRVDVRNKLKCTRLASLDGNCDGSVA